MVMLWCYDYRFMAYFLLFQAQITRVRTLSKDWNNSITATTKMWYNKYFRNTFVKFTTLLNPSDKLFTSLYIWSRSQIWRRTNLPTFPFCSNICFESGLCEISTGSDVDLANEVSTLATTAVTVYPPPPLCPSLILLPTLKSQNIIVQASVTRQMCRVTLIFAEQMRRL